MISQLLCAETAVLLSAFALPHNKGVDNALLRVVGGTTLACTLQQYFHLKFDWRKSLLFSSSLALCMWTTLPASLWKIFEGDYHLAHLPLLSRLLKVVEVRSLSTEMILGSIVVTGLVSTWLQQYHFYSHNKFLAVTCAVSTTAAHWGVTDGTGFRELTKDDANRITICDVKPFDESKRDRIQRWYIPFFQFGIIGCGDIAHNIKTPEFYNDFNNTCQTYVINLCIESGRAIFLLPDVFVLWSTIAAFLLTHADILRAFAALPTDKSMDQKASIVRWLYKRKQAGLDITDAKKLKDEFSHEYNLGITEKK